MLSSFIDNCPSESAIADVGIVERDGMLPLI
jgi:hypothetical protein